MAKATVGNVTLELSEAEARALVALLNVTCGNGAYVQEFIAIHTALLAVFPTVQSHVVRFNEGMGTLFFEACN